MDPLDELKEARTAASQGRYADALRAHVWFHEQALVHEPALQGVRLSFALADWVDLGGVYPEALRVLESIRDAKTDALTAGTRSRDLFHDVQAINRALGVGGQTYALFRQLCDIDEDFARSCASIAMDDIVDAKDFRLGARFLAEPEAKVRAWSQQLNEDVRRLPDPGQATRRLDRKVVVHARAYADDVASILSVLEGVGRAEEARSIRDLAIDAVEAKSVRASVRELLSRYGDAAS